MAKRFFNTQRIEEDWYLNLSCKQRELFRYCESKCDQAGVLNFNAKIASSYVGEKVDEADLAALPIKKLDNGRFWIVDFISEQNGELSEHSPAHKPIFKSIKENTLSELLNTLSNTLYNRVQEKEIVIDKEKDKEIEKEMGIEKESETEICPTFNNFWDEYDKKRGDKIKLQKKWEKLTQAEKEAVMEYIPHYKQSQPEKQYRKDPETFLNNKSWNDEIITTTIANGNGISAAAKKQFDENYARFKPTRNPSV